MKQLLLIGLLCSLLFGNSVDVDRFNLWPRTTVMGNFGTSKIGYFGLADMRYNITFTKTINDSLLNNEQQSIFRSDLIIGPTWSTKINQKLPFRVGLLYHPMFNITSEVSPTSFVRHSLELRLDLKQPIKKGTIRYRIIGWNWFSTALDNGRKLNNEVVVRILLGGVIPLNKQWQIIVDEEIVLKPTADKSDWDGTEVFNKNNIWAGIQWHPNALITVKLQYMNAYTRNMRTETKNVTLVDNSIMANVIFTPPQKK